MTDAVKFNADCITLHDLLGFKTKTMSEEIWGLGVSRYWRIANF